MSTATPASRTTPVAAQGSDESNGSNGSNGWDDESWGKEW